MRPQQNLQTGLEREHADLTVVAQDPDGPLARHRRVFLDQFLNDSGREQDGVDIVSQRCAIMAMAIDSMDRVNEVESVKRHGLWLPQLPNLLLTLIKSDRFLIAQNHR